MAGQTPHPSNIEHSPSNTAARRSDCMSGDTARQFQSRTHPGIIVRTAVLHDHRFGRLVRFAQTRSRRDLRPGPQDDLAETAYLRVTPWTIAEFRNL